MIRTTAFLGLLALAASAGAGEGDVLIVKAAHFFDGADEVTGKTLLIKDGTVVESAVAEGAEVIDAAGLWVTPGWVDANTRLGLLGADVEATREVTPRFDIALEFDETDPRLSRALASGVTTAYVSPGARNVISGLGAVVRAGKRWRILARAAALEFTLNSDPARGNSTPRSRPPNTIYSRRPTTRMGVVWILRRALYAAAEEGDDPDLAVVRKAARGEIPLRTLARREEDIRTACRIAREFGIRGFTVEDGVEAHRAVDVLKERGAKVILGPPYYSERGRGPDQSRVHLGAGKALSDAGIPFAISSGSDGTGLKAAAALAWRFGTPRKVVLAAVTAGAAEILGVADRVGSIRPGRRADLVFFDGDPLEASSRVVRVIVGGETLFELSEKGSEK